MAGLILLAALIVAVLERTHRRHPRPTASTDPRDRDHQRLRAELAAVAERQS
jgi:hypothetical protein